MCLVYTEVKPVAEVVFKTYITTQLLFRQNINSKRTKGHVCQRLKGC